jgi:DNA primase
MIDKQIIDRILQAANIVDVVGDYVELKRQGTSYKGFCPFHDDRGNPNLSVSPSRGIFNCFSCGEKGNAIHFIQKMEKIQPIEAIRLLAAKYHIATDEPHHRPAGANFEKIPPQAQFSWVKKAFTDRELKLLGKDITAEVCEKQFSLFSAESFTTVKNDKGESWKISGTEDFPIFIYDYGTFGKIYQPLSDKHRFTFWGEKPKDAVFGDSKTMQLYRNAENGIFPEMDEQLDSLVIVSGGSDALNARVNGGFNVAFLNSETAGLTSHIYRNFQKIVRKDSIFLLYDMDRTGISKMQETALKFLDIRVVYLPEDLGSFKTPSGKPCKDVKDFFLYYRSSKYPNKSWHFKRLVATGLPLKFWTEKPKTDKDDNITEMRYEINNEQMYHFLNASGLYTYSNEQLKKRYSFIQIDEKTVYDVCEEEIQSHVNTLLVSYIKNNLQYFDIQLINMIHRSNQAKISSLEKLRRMELDLNSFSAEYDTVYFRDKALLITGDSIKECSHSDIDKHVFDFNILPYSFHREPAMFEIEHTQRYRQLRDRFLAMNASDAEYHRTKKEYETFPDTEKFKLTLHDSEFSFLKFVYNTGRLHWQKELEGHPLSEPEQAEHDLNFINKACALGYLMYRYKDPSKAWMVYGIETELSDVGQHRGGTGKSLLLSSIEYIRNMVEVDGQQEKMKDDDTFFSGVRYGRTNVIYFDDLSKAIDLHFLMPRITGKMTVRSLYENSITIDFAESPKISVTSNHAPVSFDSSLRRRTWFMAFSNYYHPEDIINGYSESSPFKEFGKNLIVDYDESEMNKFYNFMVSCLHFYLKFRERINPPMESIDRRTIQRSIGDDFITWAEDYFTPERLNVNLEKNEVFKAYQQTMPEKIRDTMKIRNFKNKLLLYCQYAKYIFNPVDLMSSKSEFERNEIRKCVNTVDYYYWHLRTSTALPHTPKDDTTDGSDGYIPPGGVLPF